MSHYELTDKQFVDNKGFPATKIHTSYSTMIIKYVWMGIVGITFILCVSGLIVGFGQLQNICTGTDCHPLQLTMQEAQWNEVLGFSVNFYAIYITLALTLFCGVCFIIGVTIFVYIPDNWMGMYVSLCLITFGVGAVPILVSLHPIVPQVQWWSGFIWVIGGWSLPLMLYIFPDGRFIPKWLRWIVLAWIIYTIYTTVTEPMPVAGIMSGPPSMVTLLVFMVGGLSQIYRYLNTRDTTLKKQTKWAVFGFTGHVVCLVSIVLAIGMFPPLREPGVTQFFFDTYAFAFLGLFPILFVPLTLAFCILRHQLWDIDIVINRTLVYGILTAIVIGFYTVVVGGLSSIFHSNIHPVMSLLATGIIAVSFHSIRDVVQRSINRLMFGHRDEPYTVLENLSRQLEPVVRVDEILPTIVQAIGKALNLPYVAIALLQESEYAVEATYPENESKRVDNRLIKIPLDYQALHIGQLWLAPRRGTETFTLDERSLLTTIARQASIAAYNIRLTRELQRSREVLVTTLEEERRRMRRDIHDGLGPVLASISVGLDAIDNLAEQDSQLTQAIARELKEQVKGSLSEVRRIAYNLRPPTLDELGLIGALREHFNKLDQSNHPKIKFTTSAHTLDLPAAVEVATYRIVLEAVTNVQHHAQARHCYVDLTLTDSELQVCVSDDGIGIPDDYRAGVGITSMRERAEELGGQCQITNQSKGMQIEAILPIQLLGTEGNYGQ